MELQLQLADILSLILYLGGMASIGVYFLRKNTSTEEYFVGGRSFVGWAVGLSMVGTSISSITFLAYPADAYKTAWFRYLPNFMLPLGVFIAAYVFLPFFRRGRITSAYEYLEGRYGPSIRLYAASAFIVSQLVRISMILYLVSMVIMEITGLSVTTCIFIAGIFVAVYTVIGGINAVIWTDVLQTVVLVVGGLLCFGIIVGRLPGGMGQIVAVACAEGKLSFSDWVDGRMEPISWGFSWTRKTGLMMLLLGLTNWLTEYSGNQNVVQRYCASRSAREARKAMFVCAGASVPIWAFFMFLGTSLFVFFKEFPDPRAAAMLSGAQKAEQILPFFVIHYLPVGIKGIVIAAALAAAMSSLDSSINAIATVGVVDILKRHLFPQREDRWYLRMAWGLSLGAGLFMIVGAMILSETESSTLQDIGTMINSVLGGGILGVYLLGFLTRRGDARAVGCGILCTILFTGWTLLAKFAGEHLMNHSSLGPFFALILKIPFDLYYTTMIGNLILFSVGFLVGTWLPGQDRDWKNLTVWTQEDTPLD